MELPGSIFSKYAGRIQSDCKFECVKADEIGNYDGVFMTGTSPMVLPFFCIGEKKFNVNYQFTEKLRKLYLEKAEASIRLF